MIVTFQELCEALKARGSTLRKRWKEFPHFFIGTGCQVDSARFILEKVVEYLENANKRQETRNVHGEIHVRRGGVSETGVRNNSSGKRLGGARKAKAKVSSADTVASNAKSTFRVLSVFGDEVS